MNAFTVGSPENAAIAVSQSLLDGLSYSEISAVLAHEVSHIRSNDMRIIGFADMANRLIHGLSLFGQLLLIISLPLVLFGNSGINLIAIALLIFAPVISAMLQLALSRTREYNADLGAVELMGNPESLATALAKIEHHGTTFFKRLAWPVNPDSQILRTHPPTRERIRRLLAIGDRQPNSAGDSHSRPKIDFAQPVRIITPTNNWGRMLNISY
jgi:heat shock protein HtpX